MTVDYRALIKSKRLERKWSQAQLAKAVDISQPYLYEIECGRKTPSLDVFFRLCEELGIRLFPDEP